MEQDWGGRAGARTSGARKTARSQSVTDGKRSPRGPHFHINTHREKKTDTNLKALTRPFRSYCFACRDSKLVSGPGFRALSQFHCVEFLSTHSGPFLEQKKLRVIARRLANIATDHLTMYDHDTLK